MKKLSETIWHALVSLLMLTAIQGLVVLWVYALSHFMIQFW